MPFLQVIVDNAEVLANRLVIEKLAVKRIICSTSNVQPGGFQDLVDLVKCVDPLLVERAGAQFVKENFSDVRQMKQLQHMWELVSPKMIKGYQHELDTLFGQLNQIELLAPMTNVQKLFYSEIYEQHGELLVNLSELESLSPA